MTTDYLAQIKVVLVRTYHPGNIGSAARAMKTMGLEQLVLVDPVDFPDSQAQTMAAGASDVLDNVLVVGSVLEAVADCSVVAACSARSRGYDLPPLAPRACAERLLTAAVNGPVALVFGPERHGLSNEDLQHATHRVLIDANPEYSSLNLAAAVQILSHELRQANSSSTVQVTDARADLPSAESLNHYFERMTKIYSATGFVNRAHPGELEKRLRHLYARAEIDSNELSILQGMLSSVDKILHD